MVPCLVDTVTAVLMRNECAGVTAMLVWRPREM